MFIIISYKVYKLPTWQANENPSQCAKLFPAHPRWMLERQIFSKASSILWLGIVKYQELTFHNFYNLSLSLQEYLSHGEASGLWQSRFALFCRWTPSVALECQGVFLRFFLSFFRSSVGARWLLDVNVYVWASTGPKCLDWVSRVKCLDSVKVLRPSQSAGQGGGGAPECVNVRKDAQ
jgi:hypothetical protein